jgi:hypothetical protein
MDCCRFRLVGPILLVNDAASNGVGAAHGVARAGTAANNPHSSAIHARSVKRTAGAVAVS